ncbi:MAG TPA: hypothetical protein PK122_03225 [Candidatus Paceibacterota bacterium]|nr:hypothetical protein [Candidatus Paceibacterota bacterium]
MKCQICNQEVKNLLALSAHIQFKHGNKKKEYYDLYMKNDGEGFCKICGSPTNFRIFSTGYAVYCSKECEAADYSDRMKNENPMKNQVSKDNQRNTNQKRYGVNSTMQLQETLEKRVSNNLEKYGVENVSKIMEVMDKANKSRSETCMKEHGFAHYFMVPEIQEKIKKTFIKKYGFPNAMQNREVFLRNQKSGCCAKNYKDLYYRGSFELDFLKKYYDKFKIEQGLSIPYIFNGKNKIYHSDFWIPELNLVVEIKNSYLNKKYRKKNRIKKAAVLAAGYNFIMIINKDYKGIESYK